MKSLCAALVLSVLLGGSAEAGSWQLAGFSGPSMSFTSQNPDDPTFKATVTEKIVVIMVADENGVAVGGLKAGNFGAFGYACDTAATTANGSFPCRAFDLRILSFPNNPHFEELAPGVYQIIFRYKDSGNTAPINQVFLKVYRSLAPGEIAAARAGGGTIPERQKAQGVF